MTLRFVLSIYFIFLRIMSIPGQQLCYSVVRIDDKTTITKRVSCEAENTSLIFQEKSNIVTEILRMSASGNDNASTTEDLLGPTQPSEEWMTDPPLTRVHTDLSCADTASEQLGTAMDTTVPSVRIDEPPIVSVAPGLLSEPSTTERPMAKIASIPSNADFLGCFVGNSSENDTTSVYCMFNNKTTWRAAMNRCNYYTGHLVYIESREENGYTLEWFVRLKQSSGDLEVWIGLNDIGSEGVWKWGDRNASTPFLNWEVRTDEPNGSPGSGHDCAVMTEWFDGTWLDIDCNELRNYICEFEIEELINQP